MKIETFTVHAATRLGDLSDQPAYPSLYHVRALPKLRRIVWLHVRPR